MTRMLAAAGLLLFVSVANANVVRLEIVQTTPVAAPRGAENIGPFEQITGKIHGELDPNDPKNAIITDIALAPRNAKGKVEYVATFTLVKPVDMTKSSGVLRYTVVNRGGGQAVASPDGHVTLVSGWQGDVVPTANNQTMTVPVAKKADGTSITGPLVLRFTNRFVNQAGNTIPLTIPREQPPYPPATLDTRQATLIAITSQSAAGVRQASTVIPGTDWAFADCGKVGFPGTPDGLRLCLKNGFKSDTVYEIRYVAKDPLVLGVGLAATRDINAFFRYEKQDAAGNLNPVAGSIKWGISEGSSQSGTFLKLYVMLGFNQDEAGRRVWDGVNPNIAGRNIDLNRRFALPGGNVMLYSSATSRRAGGASGATPCAATEWPAFSIAAAARTRARRFSRRSARPRFGVCGSRIHWSGRRRKQTSNLQRKSGGITSPAWRMAEDRADSASRLLPSRLRSARAT